jgi:hypothetical protein
MTFNTILAIAGKPGLYHLKTQTRNGFVALSLIDGKITNVVTGRNEVTMLSDIAVYTLQEELPLRTVFQQIKTKENGEKTPVTHKDDAGVLQAYFTEVLPNYDPDKVFPNHIRKIIQWYNLLWDKKISFEAEPTGEKENQPA